MLTLHTGARWRSPTTYICTEHRQRHFGANMKETYLIKFLWDWCALQFTPTWKWNSFFCWSSKRERSLFLGHSGGHHPWEDRCQKDSASYTVTNCGDLGTPEPLCHCFFKKGGGLFQTENTNYRWLCCCCFDIIGKTRIFFRKPCHLGMVAYTCKPRTWEAGARSLLWVQRLTWATLWLSGQSELSSKMSQNKQHCPSTCSFKAISKGMWREFNSFCVVLEIILFWIIYFL